MFDVKSRYAGIQDAKIIKDDREIIYKKRRFLPNGDDMTLLQEITISAGDRLDNIAARILGDPEQFWLICDANNSMHPLDLTSMPGNQVRIARPWG